MWVAFFIFWGGAASVLGFSAVYYESVGLAGSQIGQLNSIPLFITLLSSVVFGFLSDISKRNRLILRICTVGLIAALFMFPRVGTFAAFLPIVFIYSIFSAPINPIIDETTLVALENPEIYGKVRVGGSIGWGLMVLISGFLIDNLGIGISVIFYINIAFLLVFFLVTEFMPRPGTKETGAGTDVTLQKLGKMLVQPGFMLIFLLISVGLNYEILRGKYGRQ